MKLDVIDPKAAIPDSSRFDSEWQRDFQLVT